MVPVRNRLTLAAIACGLCFSAVPAAAQLEARIKAIDVEVPRLYSGQPVDLETCLEVGEVASMTLASLDEDLGVAAIDRRAAWAQWLPTLDASASWSRSERTDFDSPIFDILTGDVIGTEDRVTRSKNKSARLSANWLVFSGMDRIAEGRQARASLDAAEASRDYQRRVVREKISDAYYDLQRAYARVKVAIEAEELASQELERGETYYELGISTKSDLLQARVRHQQTKLDVVREHTAQRKAFIGLAYAMNIPGARPFEITSDLPVVDRGLVSELDPMVERARSERLDIATAEYTLDARRHGVTRARAGYFPRVSLFSSWSRSENDVPQSLRFGAQTNGSVSWGVQGTWSIFDGWRREQGVRQAVAAQRQAEYQLRQKRMEAELEVATVYSNLIDAVESYELSTVTVEQSLEDLRLAKERFRVGAGTQLDVITAQVNLATVRRDAVDAQVNYAKFLNQMRRAAGGDVIADR